MNRNHAFTLIELLVVISIISLLAGLSLGGIMAAKKSADRTVATSQMRQIGLAVIQYAGDNDGTLPGPLKAGQGAVYDPGDSQQLATALGTYLGVSNEEEEQLLKIFIPPAYARAMSNLDPSDSLPYVLNISASVNGQAFKPWGSTAAPVSEPMKLFAVRSGTWAICDADQQNPMVKGQPWASKTPVNPVHGSKRLAWFFDGSVSAVEQSSLKPAGGGSPPPPPPPPPPPH